MPREKDKLLANDCRRMAQVSVDALDWIDGNRERIGVGVHGIQRTFKKHAVEARKLATAAERPMSVGVFGASQAGKSFLIGALIAPPERPAKVLFGEGEGARRLDFLSEVNPQGGDETTGLVTRFSIAPFPPVPGHEVALRLLGEVDVVKILANTYLFDLSAEPADGMAPLGDTIDAAIGVAADAPVDSLQYEDVFELREYFEKSLYRHPLASDVDNRFWMFAEEYLPRLRPDQRAKALAPLWGGYARLTELYGTLKSALDQLGHPEWAFAPLSAITDRAGGILHVGTLYGLDTDIPGGSAPVMVAAPKGPTVGLPKPVVTALTAELRVTLDTAPWQFFENTDLLDFPGARSRLESSAREWLDAGRRSDGRAQCYLRGKVAVLFDKYAAELDLNTMLLCVGPENQEVRKLPELVEGWIGETHGRTPMDRADRRVSLFLCLTKADKLFDVASGSAPDQSVKNRLSNNFNFYPGWTTEWAPSRAFDNTFLIRNPNFSREDLFDYHPRLPDAPPESVPAEARVRADKVEWLNQYEGAFLAEPLVQDHVAEPETRWSAMLDLNDGGISHLADRLVPVCDPDLKYEQIAPRARALKAQMLAELSNYYEEGDPEKRVAERTAKAKEVRGALRRNPHLIGRFMAELMADPTMIGQRYLAWMRRSQSLPTLGASDGIELPPDDLMDEPAVAETANRSSFAHEALDVWFDELNRKVGDETLCRAFDLTPEQFQFVVEELRVGVRRLDLVGRIETTLEKLPRTELPTESVHRVALANTVVVNAMVATLGSAAARGNGAGVGDGAADEARIATVQRRRSRRSSARCRRPLQLAQGTPPDRCRAIPRSPRRCGL